MIMKIIDIKKIIISICALYLFEIYRMSFCIGMADNGIGFFKLCFTQIYKADGDISLMGLSAFVFWHLIILLTFGGCFNDSILKNADMLFIRCDRRYKLLIRCFGRICIWLLFYMIIMLLPFFAVCIIRGMELGTNYKYMVMFFMYLVEVIAMTNVLSIYIEAIYSMLFTVIFTVLCVYIRKTAAFLQAVPVNLIFTDRQEGYLFFINIIYFFIIMTVAIGIDRKEVY